MCDEFDLLTHATRGGGLVTGSARGYLLEGGFDEAAARTLTDELLVDPLVESAILSSVPQSAIRIPHSATVLLKPGVMDPAAESVVEAARDLGVPLDAVRTFRRYFGPPDVPSPDRDVLFRKVLANDAIEQVVAGPLSADHLGVGSPYASASSSSRCATSTTPGW